MVAFGIRHFGCVAGVVVTASHNPPQDNGYKVYLGDGSQIVPPADAEIAARIDEVAKHNLDDVPRARSYAISATSSSMPTSIGSRLVVPDSMRRAQLRLGLHPAARRGLVTGGAGCRGVAGFPPADVVAEQAEPDPRVPDRGVSQPEEPGAIDLALARAAEVGADLVIANDPDADRLRGWPQSSTGAGGCSAVTSSACCWVTTRSAAACAARTPARSSPARCCRPSQRRTTSRSSTP